MAISIAIGLAAVAGVAGFFIGWLLRQKLARDKIARAESFVEQLVADARQEAENLKKAKQLEVQEEVFQKRQALEEEVKSRRSEIQKAESQLTNREVNLDRKVDLFNRKERELKQLDQSVHARDQALKIREEELARLITEENRRLEQISGLTNEEAKRLQLNNYLEIARQEGAQTAKEILDKARAQAHQTAKNIVLEAIQRTSINHVAESTVAVVTLPSDDIKGRIIGREGRNIRMFEAATGIEVLIDDTPDMVMLSGFDPIRREIAKLALEKLIADGRIHPGRIEEVVEKTRQEITERFVEYGEQAAIEAGVHGLHNELIRLLGKLKYRTSHGQNLLQHSIEVALLAGLMAAELELDAPSAKRAGLLHEIGLAVDNESESGTPGEVGAELVKKLGENELVQNAILWAHHSDNNNLPAVAPESVIVAAANEVSISRPGARKEMLDSYFQRMRQLEEICRSFYGVIKTYALQAGRELRVIVEYSQVDDAKAEQIALSIAQKIHETVHYPGQIKVTVVREYRSVSFAK
ncbi:ribonuclease Y [candidate division KSB1 bacterium]|nr:ribonuclease Y [candidate division KSB1 bacterium]